MYGNSYKYNNYGNSSNGWSALPAAAQGLLIGLIGILVVIVITLIIFQIIGTWKAFKKAGQKGWEAIVPFYNTFTLIKIAGLELWWFIVVAITSLIVGSQNISLASLALLFAVNYKIAKSYGKTLSFAIGLTLLPPIFWMILGFSQNIKYLGPNGPYIIKYPTAATPKKKAEKS